MDLVDLHSYRHPTIPTPATHQHKTLTIDTILGSPQIAQALLSAFYLPHGEPLTLPGNHRMLGIDLDATYFSATVFPQHFSPFTEESIATRTPLSQSFAKQL